MTPGRIPLPIARAAFGGYAVVLLTLTHWPRIRIEGPIPRPDLYIHFAAFGLWCVLFNLARPFGWRWQDPRSQISCAALALSYAIVDEATQAIEFFGRVFDLADVAANAGGSLLGSLAIMIAARVSTSWERSA